MPPAFIGIGGNIGIARSSRSATGDWGFTILSKLSFGPLFSVRPAVIISNDNTSALFPITFNFPPFLLWNTPTQIFAGGGVDVGGATTGLVSGGMDFAIADNFSLTAQANWRVASSPGFGIMLGVAYNFPWYFE
jgi:hypothetical protein